MPAAHVTGCSFRNTREGLTPVILLEAPLYQKASCFPRSVLLTSQWPKHHTAHLSYRRVWESRCLVLSTFVVGGTWERRGLKVAFDWPDLRVCPCPSCHPKVHTHACIFISREEIQLQSVGSKGSESRSWRHFFISWTYCCLSVLYCKTGIIMYQLYMILVLIICS